jgi:excinuclease ABC subunit C
MDIKSFKKIKMPDKPGVYFFLKDKKILYIGKATSLKERVKSYFGKDLIETRGPLIVDLAFKSDKIDWQETDSVLEALVLEVALIKKHQPKYNTKEKSDKSFNYVCITKESTPKVLIVRERNILQTENVKFKAKYGPFTNGSQLREAMKIIRPIFPFLDDKSKNNYRFYKQLNLVPDILNKQGLETYKNDIKNLKLFFEGKKKDVVKNLKKDMMLYAKNREFERAEEIKRQLFALQHINDVALLKQDPQNIIGENSFRIEAYDIAHMGGKNMVGVMVVVQDGEVDKNEYRKFKIKTQTGSNDTGALLEVLERRLAHKEWRYPDLIVVDGSTAQINIAQSVLSRNDVSIPIVSVVKDEYHKARDVKGDGKIIQKYKKEIILANSESHRFAITYHKNIRNKNFLK